MQLMKEGKWPTSSMSMSVRMLYFCFSIQTCKNLNSKEPKTSKLWGVLCSKPFEKFSIVLVPISSEKILVLDRITFQKASTV